MSDGLQVKEYIETKRWFPFVDRKKPLRLILLDRYMLGLVCQFITGFSNLSYMTNKKDNRIDPTCRLCGNAEEKAWHLITDCEALERTSRNIMEMLHDDSTWSVDELVTFLKTPQVARLMAQRRIYGG